MTNPIRKIGGIIALVGGVIAIIAAILFLIRMLEMGSPGIYGFAFLFTIILGALILIGGILLLVNKRSGGLLALIAGAVYLILLLIYPLTFPYFLVVMLLPYYLEPIFAIIGGIIGIVAGSD